jgi:hypothetical protein
VPKLMTPTAHGNLGKYPAREHVVTFADINNILRVIVLLSRQGQFSTFAPLKISTYLGTSGVPSQTSNAVVIGDDVPISVPNNPAPSPLSDVLAIDTLKIGDGHN